MERPEPTDGESRRPGPGEHDAPGSGFLGLGALKGHGILREDLRNERTAIVDWADAKERDTSEVLEGEGKVMGGIPTPLATAEPATRRNTPGSRSRDPRTKVEPPSQSNGYAGSSDTEDQHNTAEGQDARDPGRNGGRPDGGNTETDPREQPGDRTTGDRVS